MKKAKIFKLLFIACFVFSKSYGQDTLRPITGTLIYDYISGALLLDDKRPIGKIKEGKKPVNRIFGLYSGQGVAIIVKNINPLKYYAESSVSFSTTSTLPPVLTGQNMGDMFKVDIKPDLKPDSVIDEQKAENSIKKKTPAIKSTQQKEDELKTKIEIQNLIKCIKENIVALEKYQRVAEQIGDAFQSFNNLYNEMKNRDNLDSITFQTQIREALIVPLRQITTENSFLNTRINITTDLIAANSNRIKKAIIDSIEMATNTMNDCYDKLFDILLKYPNVKKDLKEEMERSKYDLKMDLVLLQLPDTRKEFFKIQEWAKKLKETTKDKFWVEIDKSMAAFLLVSNLRFAIPVGTVMADEDVANITITVKNVADNKEVRKIERIKFNTIGGFRMEYGVGLYVTGLGDDDFVIDRTTKIEKVEGLNGTAIDSTLQNVNYATPIAVGKSTINWGTMTYFQGRSNWGEFINVGGYFGFGLLLNNDAKPIFSAGISLVLGRIPRGNLNIGVAWGKVNRLNPKYDLGKEYKGDITDITVSQTQSKMLIGFTWNLGTVGK